MKTKEDKINDLKAKSKNILTGRQPREKLQSLSKHFRKTAVLKTHELETKDHFLELYWKTNKQQQQQQQQQRRSVTCGRTTF